MLNLVIVNVGNSSRTEISIVVLTHIAWAATPISVSQVFPTTFNLDVARQYHASCIYNRR